MAATIGAITARDERHHPCWLMALASAWHSVGGFPAACFADRGQPGAMQMPQAWDPGHVLIGTKRQTKFDQTARLTRWSDFSA